MTDFIRTPDDNFVDLVSFPYEPHYRQWQDLRLHYVDEGPPDGPVMLLLHGMPTWSYLYRDMIPGLVAAGYRCIVPDHLGFGRSDKPTDPHWYTIARHTEVLTTLITGMDLTNVTLVCQDWGGPIGLAQAMTMPKRFSRLVIMNTWLHHEGYEYTEGIRNWNRNWHEGGLFDRQCPDVGLLLVLAAGLAGPDVILPALLNGTTPDLTGKAADEYRGFSAPFAGLPDAGFNGLRRFPSRSPSTITTMETGRRRITTLPSCSRGTNPSTSSGDAPIRSSPKHGEGPGRSNSVRRSIRSPKPTTSSRTPTDQRSSRGFWRGSRLNL